MSAFPTLNWKEIEFLARGVRPQVEGLFVDRVIVPERARFQGGYVKGEWAIRLTGRHDEGVFILSIRTRHPYFYFIRGKGPKAAPQGTRSAFDLELTKYLRGRKLISFETLPRERTAVLWFSDPEARSEGDRLGLVMNLIPAAPEALLIHSQGNRIITRSRLKKTAADTSYVFPDGSQAPENPALRSELVSSSEVFTRTIERALEIEAFENRLNSSLREIRSLDRQAQQRMKQTETTLREARNDQDWQRYGDLLKAVLHESPQLQPAPGGKGLVRWVTDYTNESPIALPADPKLGLSEQVEKYYQLSRRKERRISEAASRLDSLTEVHQRFSSVLQKLPVHPDWAGLEKLERIAHPGIKPASGEAKKGKKSGAWLGKTFTSRDGLAIFVGRSKDENLELTFKHARGNDVWMHVRGRPGAHVLIPIQPGKSAPLETLLDAAALCIYYSGGENWGKTEVDYAFKKHVRRIKDSTEASYTHNKTLLVEPEPSRLKRLISQNG